MYRRRYYGKRRRPLTYESNVSYNRRSYYKRNFRRRGGKLDKLSFQGLTVRIKYTYILPFNFNANSNTAVSRFPVLGGGTNTSPALILQNNVFSTYANIYDEFKLQWAKLSTGITQFPVNQSAMRMHILLDRKYSGSDGGISIDAFSIMNNPGTQSRVLNNAQYNILNFFTRASSLEEKTSYFDSTLSITSGQGIGAISSSHASNSGFYPGWYIVLESNASFTAQTTINLSITAEIKLRFRNPKLSGVLPIQISQKTEEDKLKDLIELE